MIKSQVLILLVIMVFNSLSGNAQTDTIYFKPVHPAISEGSVILGVQVMGPRANLTGTSSSTFESDFDFNVKAGVFLQQKTAVGGSLLSSRYYDRNNIAQTMYLYGAFLRMYQNDNNPNYFLEAGINYGKKKLLLDGLDETVDKKFLGDVGIGWVWIDQSIMLEASVNLKFLSHTYLDLNTMISEKTTTGYVQPQLAIFFYL